MSGVRAAAVKALFLSLSVLAVLSGCAGPPCRPGAADLFPGDEKIVLREGDIVLARSPGFMSAAISHFGIPAGPYSHSAMYFRTREGCGRLMAMQGDGLNVLYPPYFFDHYEKLALLRLKDATDAAAAGEAARRLRERDSTRKVGFDYKLAMETEGEAKFFCNELLSYLYRDADLSDPFGRSEPVRETRWIRWARDRAGVDLVSTVPPNAVLENAEFEKLAELDRTPEGDPGEVIEAVIFRKIRSYVTQGHYEPRGPDMGSRVMIFLERTLFMRDMVRQLPHPRQRHLHYSLLEFSAGVKRRTRWLLSKAKHRNATAEDVRRLTERVCDAYRDDHFKPGEKYLAERGR